MQILKVRTVARAARLFAAGILHQRIDLDDIGAPVRELPHAGRPGADASEIKHAEAGQGLRGTGKGIQGVSRLERKYHSCGFQSLISMPYWHFKRTTFNG